MLIDLLGMVIANIIVVLSVYNLNDIRLESNDKKIYISLALYNIAVLIGTEFNSELIKPFYNFIILLFVAYIVNKNDTKRAFLSSLIVYSLLMLMEVLIIFIIISFAMIFFKELTYESCIDRLNNDFIYAFIFNFISALLVLLLCNNKFIKKIYLKFNNIIKDIKIRKTITLSLFLCLSIFVTYATICYSNNEISIIVMFIILIFIISYILLKDLNVRSEYENTKEKYSNVQHSLVEYEDMIDKYRVNNHENKNQLLTIQNMIKNHDRKVNDYIDNLVGTVYMNNEKTMMDISVIPAGGLRATIHTKLNIMDNKNINYVLDIDRKIRIIDFETISLDLNLKICKIVSIFIDNAIEEVETHQGDKIVNIEMYINEEKLVIEISNIYENQFDVNKIFDKKYTTKSSGHGYGLSLAKELIDSEKKLNNFNCIEDNIFTQVLEVEIKK